MDSRLRMVPCLIVVVAAASGLGLDNVQPKAAATKFTRGVLIRIEGDITPFTEKSLERKLAVAKERRADLLVIELDSPGGLVDSSLNIADRLSRIDWARTVAFVPRRAMSGAAIISLGCDEIVIAPTAQYGDAGMIQLSLDEGGFVYAPEKARSALASHVRTLAEAKGRPPALAEAFVDMSLVVFQVRNKVDGRETYLSDAEINSSANPEQWVKIKPLFETREKHFLTMNGKQAVDMKMAQALIGRREELRQHFQLSGEFLVLKQTGVDTAVTLLNLPFVTGLLFVVGLVALYFEFQFPGTCLGGMIAGLCFAIFFWSRFLGGTAGWLEVILFLAGLVFIGLEMFVIPGFGIAGISGGVLIIASLVMASQSFLVPHSGRQLNTTLTQIGILATSGTVFLIAAVVASRYLGSIPLFKALLLETPSASGPNQDRAATVNWLLSNSALMPTIKVGDEGMADSTLRPAGKARFGNAYVDVVADGVYVDPGKAIRVILVAGNRVVVREIS